MFCARNNHTNTCSPLTPRMGLGRIWLALLAIGLIAAGCLPFPLGDPAKSKVDASLNGTWLFERNGQGTYIVMYPFDERAYVVEYIEFEKGAELTLKQHHVFKGWLTDVKGSTFLTIESLALKLPGTTEKPVYPVFRLTRKDQTMETKFVNEDFDGFKGAGSAEDVANVIAREVDNPKLYREDPPVYRKLNADADKDAFEQLGKLVKR